MCAALGCMAFRWSVADLLEATALEKSCSSCPSSCRLLGEPGSGWPSVPPSPRHGDCVWLKRTQILCPLSQPPWVHLCNRPVITALWCSYFYVLAFQTLIAETKENAIPETKRGGSFVFPKRIGIIGYSSPCWDSRWACRQWCPWASAWGGVRECPGLRPRRWRRMTQCFWLSSREAPGEPFALSWCWGL